MKKLLIPLMLLISCSRDIKVPAHEFIGGSLKDDETTAIPVTVSSEYSLKIPDYNFLLRGKPVKGDRSAPIVIILSPANQSTVTGTVQITASATDNVGVVSTTLSIDNVQVSPSLSYSWNTSIYSSGYHTITATAKDAAGNTGFSSVTVLINTVVIDTPPPPSTEVSLITPTPGNQGGEGSCIGWAVGYAARSIEEYYKTGASSYSNSVNVFSPEYLYDQVKFSADCGSGAAMQPALDFILANGICTWQTVPYSATNGCSLTPTTAQITEAANYKISGYTRLYCTDKVAIKSRIDQHHAVIISMGVDNQFLNAGAGFIWKSNSGIVFGHAMVICGYDDTKNAYKVMSSFGTSWGDKGFSWIDYDFFPTSTGTYCYSIN